MAVEIEVPVLQPRSWQRAIFAAAQRGVKRMVVVAHRRSGKTVLGLSLLVMGMIQRPGLYVYVAPFLNHGRKVLWDGIDHDGKPLRDHFPAPLVAEVNENEMQVRLKNGALFQVLGADQPDRLRGMNPFGVVFDEYATMVTAHAWDLMRPILAENGGWAAFLYTPMGRNHGYALYQQARGNPEWHVSLQTIDDTRRDAPGEAGGPIISAAQVAEEIRAGMPEALAEQEFRASWLAATPGAYYVAELERLERDGRVRGVPWEPTIPVVTAWDLGIDDATAIVFCQLVAREVRVIDYHEGTGKSLADYVKLIAEKSYRYHEHLLPHDARVRELGTGKSRVEMLRALGLERVRVLPALPLMDGIHAVRLLLARTYFDRDRTRELVKALEAYAADWDEGTKAFATKPRHDWSSHGADAMRYLAQGVPGVKPPPVHPIPKRVPLPQYAWTRS